jgi:transposase
MPKRSRVKLYEQIRRSHERDGLSVRELARRFHVHRRDVRQALASAVPPERKKPQRPATALDRWKPTIDGWLEADRAAPRKQRHTARRVWQRLVDEHGAAVGESTVRRYVAEVRRRMEVPLVEVMVPQHHPLGDELRSISGPRASTSRACWSTCRCSSCGFRRRAVATRGRI